MVKSPGRNDTPQREETSSCAFTGCCGCFICYKSSTPKTPWSWADVVTNRHRRFNNQYPDNQRVDLLKAFDADEDDHIGSCPNSNNSISQGHVTPGDDHINDTPSTDSQIVSTENNTQRTEKINSTLKKNTKKNKWSREEMKEVIWCFCIA